MEHVQQYAFSKRDRVPHVGDGWWSFAGLWVSTLAHCDGIAERDAGLSVLGSALLMVPEVVVYLSVVRLIRRKTRLTLSFLLGDSIGLAVNDVGMLFPRERHRVTHVLAHLRDGLDVTMTSTISPGFATTYDRIYRLPIYAEHYVSACLKPPHAHKFCGGIA